MKISTAEKARWFRIKTIVLIWSKWRDSNSRHPAPKAGALPTALHLDRRPMKLTDSKSIICTGANRATADFVGIKRL